MGNETMIIIVVLASILVASIITVAGMKATTGLTNIELDIITEQTTRAIANILVSIPTVEQGVRHFDLKKNFAYELNQTHIRLTYIGETHTLADETGVTHTFAMPHYQEDIVYNANIEGTERICISKKIVDCMPQVTICDEGQECCNLQKNTCKYIAQ